MLNRTDLAPGNESELAEIIRDCHASAQPLHIAGGGTRLPPAAVHPVLNTQALAGITLYEPGELTLIARAGTPLTLIEQRLAAEGQALAFEPMDHRAIRGTEGEPTSGGMVAANISGPRRIQVGACRDHLLGLRFVDGRGRVLKTGGRVMKNVTGMDLGKLLCGSWGTLAVLTEVALKTLPMAEAQQTLVFPGVSAGQAVAIFSTALSTPFEVSGAAFHDGTAWLRIEGLTAQVAYRRDRLIALLSDHDARIIEDADSRALWRDIRDIRHFAEQPLPLWRILLKPGDSPAAMAALQALGGQASLDWGGGLIWYCGDAPAAQIRQAASAGSAMLLRGSPTPDSPRFQPQSPGVARLSLALRRTFDPACILNPGLMEG